MRAIKDLSFLLIGHRRTGEVVYTPNCMWCALTKRVGIKTATRVDRRMFHVLKIAFSERDDGPQPYMQIPMG